MALKKTGVQLIAQDATKFIGDLADATNALKAFVGAAQSGASAIGASMGQAQHAMGAFAGTAQSMAKSGAAVQPSLNTAQGAVTSFAGSVEKSGGVVSGASQIMIGALRQIGTMAVSALASAASATAGFVKDSIGLAGDFQQGMLEFQAAAGADVDTAGLEKFRSLFIQLGRDLPVSTSEVQQAAIELIKGGIDPAIVAAGGLKQNIQFAAAALKGDLVQAAEISSKVLGGWGADLGSAEEKAAFLTHATDLLTKAANASSVEVPELARGLYNVQGAAQAAGISFDDVTTVLAELAPRFASSAEAGTSLKNFIARLQPTTDPAIDAMQALGLYTEESGSAFYDAQGEFVGFQKASQLLQDSLAGLTDAQRVQMLQTIFGNDAMGAASAMAQEGADGYDKMAASLAKANGVEKNAEIKQQGFNTALENTKGSIEALKITIGSALLPILGNLLDKYIAPAINAVTTFADVLFRSNNPIATIAATIGDVIPGAMPLLRLIHNLTYAFTEMPNPIAGVGEALNILIEDIFGIKTNIGSLIVDGIQALASAFSEGGVIGAIDLFVSSYSKINPVLRIFSGVVQEIFPRVQQIITSVFSIINGVISSHGKTIINDITSIWGRVNGIIDSIVPPISSVIITIFDVIQNFLQKNGKDIQNFITSTWDTVADIINIALDIIDATIVPAFNSIAQFISDNSDNIQLVLQGAWDIIKNTIQFALTLIQGLLTTFLKIIKGDWSGAWETIKTTAEKAWNNIKGVVDGAIKILQGFLSAFWDALQKGALIAWDAFKKIVSDAWVAIKQNISTAIQNIIASISNATQPIQTAMSGVWDAAKAVWDKLTEWTTVGTSIIDGIISGVVKAAKNLASAAAQAGADAIAAAKKAIGFGSPAKKFIPLGESIPDGIAVGIRRKQGDLNELGQSILDGLVEGIESSVKSMEDAMQSLSDDIYDSFKDAIGAGSPAKEFIPLGQSIIQGVAEGAQDQASFLKGTIDQVIDAASAFGGVGGVAKARIEEGLDAKKKQLALIKEEYDKYNEAQKIRELSTEEREKWIELAVKQHVLTDQITAQEAAITDYQKQQNDLAYVRQQMDLMKFIQENNLNPQEVLQGVGLGVNADPQKLLEAMNRAMQQAVEAMQHQLGELGEGTGMGMAAPAKAIAPAATPAQQIMMQRPSATTNYYGNVDYGSKVNMPIQSAQGPGDIYQSLSLARIQAMMPA